MESLKLEQMDGEEIEKNIKLNLFSESQLGSGRVEGFGVSDLLSPEEMKEEKKRHEQRDSYFESFSIKNILKYCLKDKEFNVLDNGSIEIKFFKEEFGIPESYGFKGGVARSVLRESLGLRKVDPRDFDVIRHSDNEPWEGADEEIARKYMEQDFEFGDGVEVIIDIDNYLETRDFTINEVYTKEGVVVATEQCIRDTLRGIVRVTDFEKSSYGNDSIGPKMKSKALRFHTEQQYMLGVSSIYSEDLHEIDKSFINPFWIAVQLDRSFERSDKIADGFAKALNEYSLVPEEIKTGYDLLEYLQEELYDDSFYFRNAPVTQILYEDIHMEQESDEVDDIGILENYFDCMYFGDKH